MALKNFFTGKSGIKFWANIVVMVCLVVALPVATLYLLDSFTHHGEKIEVPSVVGKSVYDAETMLKDRGLTAMVVDSVYDRRAPRGSVLEQSPKAGYEVKGGRMVYLTVNLLGEPMVQMPDVVGHGSLREAVALLQSLGFKLTPNQQVMGRPKDLVIGVKQGTRDIHAGESIPRDRSLTLVVGGGEIDTTMVDEEDYTDFDIDLGGGEDDADGGADFDIEL